MYKDDAVFIAGRGAVLIAPAGTAAPSLEEVRSWLETDVTKDIGEFKPLGYTSIDELPSFDSDVEGGEKRGAWENDALRLTRITSTDTITVTPIQWTEEPLKHRFGPGRVDTGTGYFEVPDVYTSTEVAMIVVIIDGNNFVVMHFGKVGTSPEGGIELDAENFAGLPVKYTVLKQSGTPKMSIGLEALQVADSFEEDGLGV